MPVFEVGRIAVKTLGREAGLSCVIVDIIDQSYVLIDGLKIRRRRANVRHLAPTPEKLDIKKGAKSQDVRKAIEKANLTEKFEKRIKLDL
ncbi:MAG: 50S ribosomal protein L14e [Promethearchaeota archaeon]